MQEVDYTMQCNEIDIRLGIRRILEPVLPLWDDDDIKRQIKRIRTKNTGDYFDT